MNPLWGKLKDSLVRLYGKAISAPGFAINAAKTATLSVAHVLAQLWRLGIADDIGRLKEDGLRRSKAKADVEEAKARKLMAEACEAENKATLAKRNDRISKAEERQRIADASKTDAEARALLVKAEADRISAMADAQVKLIEAVSKLKQKGGNLSINPENLAGLLGVSPEVLASTHLLTPVSGETIETRVTKATGENPNPNAGTTPPKLTGSQGESDQR